jgi:2-polyprenyl-3-methyl-5-hydroxy-6-metoxy-1,4-benzoquinol methylase
MGFYYPDDYGPYQGTRVDRADLSNDPLPVWKCLALRVFEFNTQRLPALPPGRMLEIGCASGSFLHRMNNEGWEVEGLEFSEKAAESARSLGHIVHTGSLEKATEPAEPYDMVVGWMVLEHLHNPVLALQKLHRWTKPDGLLVVSVPNADALEFQIFGDAWYALQVPNHLYHYTPKTLKMMLERSGWQIERMFHQRVLSNLIASIGHVLQDKQCAPRLARRLIDFPKRPGLKQVLLYPLACLLAAFGQTGRMTVWARRVDD